MSVGLLITVMLTAMVGFNMYFRNTVSLQERASSLLIFTFLSVVVFLFSIVGISMIQRALRKAAAPPRKPRPDFPFSQQDASAWMVSIIPAVEKVSGRSFSTYPTVKLVDWLEVGALLADELGTGCEKCSDALTNHLLELTAMQSSLRMMPYVIGKYGIRTGEIYLLPENSDRLLEEAGLDSSHLDDVIRLTLAHELVHALQDQETGLAERLAGQRDPMAPFNVVIEGQAMVLQAEVARELGLCEIEARLAALLEGRAAPKSGDAKRMADVYRAGKEIMRGAMQDGGAEAMWDLIETPPASV